MRGSGERGARPLELCWNLASWRKPIEWVHIPMAAVRHRAELRLPLPARRDDFDSVCRVDREPRGQQAICEKATDALDPARRASVAADPRTGTERRSEENLRSLVSGNESGRASGAKTRDIGDSAPGMARSPCHARFSAWHECTEGSKIRPLLSEAWPALSRPCLATGNVTAPRQHCADHAGERPRSESRDGARAGSWREHRDRR